MTDNETVRLEILKALIPIASRHGIEKAQLLEPAEAFYQFVVKPPTKESTDTPAREPKKK